MMRLSVLGLSVLIIGIYAGRLHGHGKSIQKNSDSGIAGFKEFVKIIDKIDLNVTVIVSASEEKGNRISQTIIGSIAMPVNRAQLTEATLDDKTMKKFLKRIEKLSNDAPVAASYKVYDVINEVEVIEDVNAAQLIDAEIDSTFKEFSKRTDPSPMNETGLINYHYQISKPGEDGVDNVKVTFGICHVEDKEIGQKFPPEVLKELHDILPKFWWALDGESYVNRLAEHLQKKFKTTYHIIDGFEKFGVGTENYAFLEVGGSNMVVFASPISASI